MLSFRNIIFIFLGFLMCFSFQNAFASDNGVIKLDLPDAVAAAMGGAFTGQADRPSAVYFNPAGIVQMDSIQATAGLTWLQPQVKFSSSATNDGISKMGNENFLFPNFFLSAPVIKDKLYLGLGESSDFGGGVDWEANGFSQYATIKTAIQDEDYRLVGAYKITDQLSLGAGVVNDESHFEHDQAINQGTGSNVDALFKANDNAWGYDLATLFKLNDQNQFGIDYKSPIHHQYSGTLFLNNLSPFSFGSAGYFNGSSFSTKAIQKLTLPQSATFGYTLKPTSKWTINFDLEWTDWSEYKYQTTYYPNLTNANQRSVLSTGNPQLRDWTSVWAESLGVQYALTDAFRLRAGYNHHQTPIPENDVDTEFPDSDSNAFTVGFGYDLTKNLTIDLAYIADIYVSRSVSNNVDSAFYGSNQTPLSGKYSAFVNEATMSLTYKF